MYVNAKADLLGVVVIYGVEVFQKEVTYEEAGLLLVPIFLFVTP